MPQLRSLLAKPPDTGTEQPLPMLGDPGTKDDPAILKALMSFLGLEDQRPGDLASATGAALGVAAIPGKTAKEFSRLMGELIEDPNLRRAWKSLAGRYPRVAGHTRELQIGKLPTGGHAANSDLMDNMYVQNELSDNAVHYKDLTPEAAMDKLKKQSVMNIDPGSTVPPEGLIGHELVHGAQRIGLGAEFDPAYKLEKKLHGTGPENFFEHPAYAREDAETVRALGFPTRKRKPKK